MRRFREPFRGLASTLHDPISTMVAVCLHSDAHARPRFNVLLTQDRVREPEHWTQQLPRLMEPLGVAAYTAQTGREALAVVEDHPIHAALIDIATPPEKDAEPDGLWLLEVLRRRPNRLPIVVINHRYAQRRAERLLNEALRLGAFTVINRPRAVEPLLQIIRRLLEREYQDAWPPPPPEV